MDVEEMERMIALGPPTNNRNDVLQYYREAFEEVPDIIAAAKRAEEFRALLERAINDCEYATETFRKEIEEALK